MSTAISPAEAAALRRALDVLDAQPSVDVHDLGELVEHATQLSMSLATALDTIEKLARRLDAQRRRSVWLLIGAAFATAAVVVAFPFLF